MIAADGVAALVARLVRLAPEARARLAAAVSAEIEALAEDLVARAGDRGARLEDRLRRAVETGGTVIAGTLSAPVCPATPPHEIAARTARALRFVAGGRTVFARRVAHPGTPATPSPADALAARADRIRARLAAAVGGLP